VFVGAGFGYEWFRSRVFVLRWSMFVCWMGMCFRGLFVVSVFVMSGFVGVWALCLLMVLPECCSEFC